jgi:hypothetical protein
LSKKFNGAVKHKFHNGAKVSDTPIFSTNTQRDTQPIKNTIAVGNIRLGYRFRMTLFVLANTKR